MRATTPSRNRSRSSARCALFSLLVLGITLAAATAASADMWTPGASMSMSRYFHTATKLADGRVLVVGGCSSFVCALDTAELYDPGTNAWSFVGRLARGRYGHEATLLRDGRVLVTGGFGSFGPDNSAEIYDPGSRTWTPAAPMSARSFHTATRLADVPGRVLVVGGHNNGLSVGLVEIYDPTTNTWASTAPPIVARHHHSAVALADGRVLVAGGVTAFLRFICFFGCFEQFFSFILDSAEIFDPSIGRWAATAPLSAARLVAAAVALSDGRPLLIAGSGVSGHSRRRKPTTRRLLDGALPAP